MARVAHNAIKLTYDLNFRWIHGIILLFQFLKATSGVSTQQQYQYFSRKAKNRLFSDVTDTGNTYLACCSHYLQNLAANYTHKCNGIFENILIKQRESNQNNDNIQQLIVDIPRYWFLFFWIHMFFCGYAIPSPTPAIMLEHGNISWNSPVHDVTWCSGRVSNKINKQHKHSPQ